MSNTIIAKNNTVVDIIYSELGGVVVSGSGQTTLSDVSTVYEIKLSTSLETDILACDITICDGNNDFTETSALNYINFIDKKSSQEYSIVMAIALG